MESRSLPYTFGQLSVRRIVDTFPHDTWPDTYLISGFALSNGQTVSQIRTALETLAMRHDSLRTIFQSSDDCIQRIDNSASPELVIVERGPCTPLEAHEIFAGAARPRFRGQSEWSWRSVVIMDGGRPAHVGLVLDHIVADGVGRDRLIAELKTLVGETSPAGANWLLTPPPQPGELALAQRSQAWASRRRGSVGYWQKLLQALPAEVFPIVPPAGTELGGRLLATLSSSSAGAALGAIARRRGLTPASIMLALTALAMHRTFGTSPVLLTLESGNRYGYWKDVVSSMNQYTPLVVDVPPGDRSVTDFFGDVHWASITAHRHGSYHVDRIWDLVRQERGRVPEFDNFYNFSISSPAAHGRTELVGRDESIEWGRSRRRAGPRLYFKIKQSSVGLQVEANVHAAMLGGQSLEEILWWFRDTLRLLAREEDAKIGVITLW